ncbi:MAG: serine kinase [Erythrobacter sp.]
MTSLDATYYYDAFGMTIASQVPLSELRRARRERTPDISIVRGVVEHARARLGAHAFMDFANRGSIVMFWPTVGCFRIIGDHTVIVDPHPDVEERFLAFPLLGPVFAWMLSGKGLFLLHASAIDIAGRSVVFMGDKLAGKSTTAAAFLRAGYPLITDDLVAISFADRLAPTIMPAFAQVKLAEDAASAVPIAGATAQPLIHKDFPKRQHTLTSMASRPVAADWFFVLRRGGERVSLSHAGLPEAIQALNRFSYMTRFSNADWTHAEDTAHFQNCVRLANVARVGELNVPAGLERLPETVSFVVDLLRRKSL